MNNQRKTEIKEKDAFHLFVQQNFIAALKMFRSVETGQLSTHTSHVIDIKHE